MPEMEKKLEQIVEGITQTQSRLEELEKRGDTDAEIKESLEKSRVEAEKAAEALQEQKQLLAAQQEQLDLMAKEIVHGSDGAPNGEMKEYQEALSGYLRKGTPIEDALVERMCTDYAEKGLFGVDTDKKMREIKDMVAGSNVDGGFWLTTDRSASMSVRMFETSPLRPIASTVTTSSDVWEIVLDDDEPDSGWVGEVSARPDTETAQIGLIKIPVHELYAQPRLTQKIIDDAGFDIASWHQGKVQRKFGRDENSAFVAGDGASKPKGFLGYSAWSVAGEYQRNAVEQYTSATSGAIEADDLIKLQGTLLEDYQSNAQWAMSRETFFSNILTLKGEDGHYLINPRLISEGGQLVLLGDPVNLFADMPNVAANALSVCYADWQEFYTIVDRLGIRVLRDPYTSKPYVRFYTTKRVGGAVTNYEAGKILKIKA